MRKIILLLSVTLFSWLGWEIGARLGGGLMTSYLLSIVGSLFGVYLGVKINRDYLE
ncbi:MAG: hypothetical protein RQ753_04940 [Desulfurivibrionaceae bacterium]|nr:hypothetical protein [Desulfobulbales bacterium]MDT8335022.1 hypothetical protein [Desulfurivibrionaceae bacterium]